MKLFKRLAEGESFEGAIISAAIFYNHPVRYEKIPDGEPGVFKTKVIKKIHSVTIYLNMFNYMYFRVGFMFPYQDPYDRR